MPVVFNRMAYVIAENADDALASLRKPQLIGLSIFPDREEAQEALEHFQSTTQTPLHIFPMSMVMTAEITPEVPS